jgi:Phage integrase, N-terminal SAM-like domain
MEQAHEVLAFLYADVLGMRRDDIRIPEPPRLMDRLRHAIRVRHNSPRTEDRYVEWSERYIRFHGLRHPKDMGGAEIEMFLTDLAVRGHVSASTQNQALCALLFLYQNVLGIELPRLRAWRRQ